MVEKGIYRHFKGNIYEVLLICKNSETLEDTVVYKDVSDETKIWARPVSMWNEFVEHDGKKIPRFEKIK